MYGFTLFSKTALPKFLPKNCGHLPIYSYETDPAEKAEGGSTKSICEKDTLG